MPRKKRSTNAVDLKAVLGQDTDLLRPLVQSLVQEILESEMTECLGAKGIAAGIIRGPW